MKNLLFLIAIATTSICSCNKIEDQTVEIEGQYSGTFNRGENAGSVELSFAEGTWEGESEITKFPALCSGTYTYSSDSIIFEDLCIWTAEFDWTLILSGSWAYELNSEELNFWNSLGDEYCLNRVD